jgi:RNA polymerase-binding transcription factor DksA
MEPGTVFNIVLGVMGAVTVITILYHLINNSTEDKSRCKECGSYIPREERRKVFLTSLCVSCAIRRKG